MAAKIAQNPIYLGPPRWIARLQEEEKKEIFQELDKAYISGITFSGGDPLHPANIREVTALAKGNTAEICQRRRSGCIPVISGKRL